LKIATKIVGALGLAPTFFSIAGKFFYKIRCKTGNISENPPITLTRIKIFSFRARYFKAGKPEILGEVN
jgi:uncharacterized protein YneF (UPF0154 family)